MDILMINRRASFDPTDHFDPLNCINKSWVTKEEDKRSTSLTKIDLKDIVLKTMLGDNEEMVTSEVHLSRLKKSGCIRLDAKVAQTLFENQQLISKILSQVTNVDTTYTILFEGTVVLNPSGTRCAVGLLYCGAEWDMFPFPLYHVRGTKCLSAVLEC